MRRLTMTLSGAAAFLVVLVGAAVDGRPASAAEAAAWTLQETSGTVRLVREGISPVALTVGDRLEGGDWIETGSDGRALLTRAQDRILVAPSSRVGLPRENDGRFATRILQTLGTILLTVERQAQQHFEVETPLLAAVVKGTTFTVSVQDDGALVHVVEGLVEVRDLALGEAALIRPGETGRVRANRPGVDVFGGERQPGAPATEDGAQTRADGIGGGASQTSRTAAERDTAPAAVGADTPGASARVVIRHALGTEPLDVKGATRGLVRYADTGSTAKAARAATLEASSKSANDAAANAAALTARTRAPADLAPAAMAGARGAGASSPAVSAPSAAPSLAGATGLIFPSASTPAIESGLAPGPGAAPPSSGGLLAPLVETVSKAAAPVVSPVKGAASGLGLP